MSGNPDVSIVIVGLNAKQHVLNCIESIRSAVWREVTYEIIYADNGSADGSVEAVRDKYGDSVILDSNDSNLGFCIAANKGARIAQGRYLYFINDDTLVIDDALALIVEYMDENPGIGTVGSRLVYPDGAEQYSGRRFPGFFSGLFGRRSWLTKVFPNLRGVQDYLCTENLKGTDPFEVDWVSAAGQCVERDIFFSIGGFVDDYYYWHEAVFCHRLRKNGLKSILHPCSRVIHYEGQGSGPRTIASQRFHIIDFHKGAFRAFREWHGLTRMHPIALLAGLALGSRAMALLVIAHGRAYLMPKQRAF